MAAEQNEGAFYSSAKSLSRNPLGIIALFIVLVYAVAGIVVGVAKPEFYAATWHPIVLFLSLFPIIVLAAFCYLVARHHWKLYGPSDFTDQSHFFNWSQMPLALRMKSTGAATSDGTATRESPAQRTDIDTAYTTLLRDGFVLVHVTEMITPRTTPKSGRYRVRVWVEALGLTPSLKDVQSVSYRIWDDFNPNLLQTNNRDSSFDLWLAVYGEFPVLAVVTMTDGSQIQLSRYLDLPDRPPD